MSCGPRFENVTWKRTWDDAALDTATVELRAWPGHEETLAALQNARHLASRGRPTGEDLETLGGGWTGEDALAIAVCAALSATDLPDGLLLAVSHSGDSDSTGALSWNLLGAHSRRPDPPGHDPGQHHARRPALGDTNPGDSTPGNGTPGDSTPGDGTPGDGASSDGPVPTGTRPDGSWIGREHGSEFTLTPEQNAAADRFLAGARADEGQISPQVTSIADNLDGARMQGYPDFVLKGEDSLKRKFADALERYPDLTPDQVLSNIKDSVRYTIELPPQLYTDGVVSAVDDLRARGYENVTFKPTWDNPDTYKGVNSTWRDPATGRVFEVQFHSPDSFDAKMRSHELYETERVATTDVDRQRAADGQAEIFRQVDVPDNAVERLDELKRELNAERPSDPSGDAPDVASDRGVDGSLDDHAPADPGDTAPGTEPGDTPDWADIAGTTDVNSLPALHAGTATPDQAHAYIVEHHPYVLEVNADRLRGRIPGSDVNCSRCVLATDRGFAEGTPSSALPWPKGPGWGSADADFDDYARSLGAEPADIRAVSSYDEIIGDIAARGEDSHGMVYISRPWNDSAHVFNVVHDEQGVVFLDGQTGRLATLEENVDILYLPIGK